METFLIVMRESLEAALLVGILLTTVKKAGRPGDRRYVVGGVMAALALCGLVLILSRDIPSFLSGRFRTGLDILIFFLAAFFLTTMVVWMHYHGQELSREISGKAARLLESGEHGALFLLSFFGVFREGLETILFLWGIVTQSGESGSSELLFGALGVAAGIGLVVLIFQGLVRVPLSRFFSVTSVLLIFFAAGMVSAGVGRLVMIGALPPLISQVWDTSRILPEHNLFGGFMADFFGYRARPSLTVVLTTFAYTGIMLAWWIRVHRPALLSQAAGRPSKGSSR